MGIAVFWRFTGSNPEVKDTAMPSGTSGSQGRSPHKFGDGFGFQCKTPKNLPPIFLASYVFGEGKVIPSKGTYNSTRLVLDRAVLVIVTKISRPWAEHKKRDEVSITVYGVQCTHKFI